MQNFDWSKILQKEKLISISFFDREINKLLQQTTFSEKKSCRHFFKIHCPKTWRSNWSLFTKWLTLCFVQVRLFGRKTEEEKFQQIVYVNNKLDEFVYLLDVMNSVYDKVIANQPICNVLWKVIATIHSNHLFVSFQLVRMSWNIGDNRNLFLKLKTKLGLYHVELRKPKDFSGIITLTLVETQQLPDFEKNWLKRWKFLFKKDKSLRWDKSMHQLWNWYRQGEHCRIPLSKQHVSQGYWDGFKFDWIQRASCSARLPLELHWHFLWALHCTGWIYSS